MTTPLGEDSVDGPRRGEDRHVEVSGTDGEDRETTEELEPSPFPHPPWTVGLVLVAGGITLLFGLLVNPIWLVVGSPFVIALVLWLYIRLVVRPDDA